MEVNHNNSTHSSTLELVFASCLAAFAMFIVGYTAVRVYLNQPTIPNSPVDSTVIPHQASLWSDLGR